MDALGVLYLVLSWTRTNALGAYATPALTSDSGCSETRLLGSIHTTAGSVSFFAAVKKLVRSSPAARREASQRRRVCVEFAYAAIEEAEYAVLDAELAAMEAAELSAA